MAEEQTQTEQTELQNLNRSSSGNSFFTGGAASSRLKRLKGFVGKKKRQIAIISLIVTLFGGGTGGFLFFAKTFEPLHMMTNLTQSAFSITDSGEQRRSTRLMQRVMQTDNLNDPGGRNKRRTGRLVSDSIYNSRLGSFNDSMRANDLEFVFEDPNAPNRATGVRDLRTGEIESFDGFWDGRGRVNDLSGRVLDDYIDDSFLRRNLARAVPGYKAMKRFDLRQMARFKAGFTSWHYFLDGSRRGTANVRDALLGRDADRRAVRTDATQETETNADGEEVPKDQDIENKIEDNVDGKTRDAIDSVEQDIANGSTRRDAIKAHAGKLKPSGASVVLTTFGVGCIAATYSNFVESQEDEIFRAKLGIAASGLALSSEMKAPDGNTDFEQIGETLDLYHDEDEHYDQSATWKRATGQPVTGNEKDFDYTYNSNIESEGGTLGVISQGINSIGNVVDGFPLVGEACKFIGNTVVGWIFGIGEVALAAAGCVGTAGAGCAAAAATRQAVITAVSELAAAGVFEALLNILAFPARIIDNGAIMNFAELGLSMNLINIEHARSVGNVPLDESTMSSLYAKAQYEQSQMDADKGVNWKYFALENPRSLASRFAMSANTVVREPTKFAFKSLKLVPSTVAGIFSSDVRANNSTYYKNDLQGFGFTNEQIDSIEPLQNEVYVLDRLKYYCREGVDINDNSCDNSKLSEAEEMREFLVCGQITYYEVYIAEEFKYNESRKFEGAVDPKDCKEIESNQLTEAAGMWLYDRALIMNINNLSVDTPLATDFNRELLEDIAECMKSDWEEKERKGCFGGIFDEPLHIESTQSTTVVKDNSSGQISGTAQELAQDILDHPNITFDGGKSGRVRNSFVQVAEDGTASLYTANNSERVPVSPRLLQNILIIADMVDTLRISSLTTGGHSSTSHHYIGTAVDIGNESVADNIIPYLYENAASLEIHELIFSPMPSGTTTLKNGQPHTYNSSTMNAHKDHIHFSVKE